MNEKTVNSFIEAYTLLKDKSDMKFTVEFFHNDCSSEPTFWAEGYSEKILLDFVEGYGFIINILIKEGTFSFTQKNYYPHADEKGKYVSFGSKVDDETHCIVTFC